MSNEERGSKRWMLDTLFELADQVPARRYLKREDLDQEIPSQVRQLARVAFERVTEVLGYAEELCAKTGGRLQKAAESDDDEEYDYADEANLEAGGVKSYALAIREQTLIYFSRELALAYLERKQAKSDLDNQYNAGNTREEFVLAPITGQTYEALRQADNNFHQIRDRVLGEIALDS